MPTNEKESSVVRLLAKEPKCLQVHARTVGSKGLGICVVPQESQSKLAGDSLWKQILDDLFLDYHVISDLQGHDGETPVPNMTEKTTNHAAIGSELSIAISIDDAHQYPNAAQDCRSERVDEAANAHLNHDKGIRLEGVLVCTLHGVEFVLELVASRSVESRVLDVVLLAGVHDEHGEVHVHEEAGSEHAEDIAVVGGKIQRHCLGRKSKPVLTDGQRNVCSVRNGQKHVSNF
jgi:hypothetical protein